MIRTSDSVCWNKKRPTVHNDLDTHELFDCAQAFRMDSHPIYLFWSQVHNVCPPDSRGCRESSPVRTGTWPRYIPSPRRTETQTIFTLFTHLLAIKHGPNINKDTKPKISAFLKNLKGTWRQVFICRRHPIPPTYHCIYSHREGGGEVNQWEGQRGASSQEGSKIPTRLAVSPVYKHY